MKSDDATLKALALYFVKFVQAYAGESINVEIVVAAERAQLPAELPVLPSGTPTVFVDLRRQVPRPGA